MTKDDDYNNNYNDYNYNYNYNFTATQQAFLNVTPQITSTLSLIGSTWILVEIWICSNKRYFVYHKLVSTMALYSLIASVGYYLDTSTSSSRSSSSGDDDDDAIVSTTPCLIQAILLQFQLGAALYFGVLGVYYMLVISYSISEERLQDQYIETLFHLIPFLAVTGTAIAGPLLTTIHDNNEYDDSAGGGQGSMAAPFGPQTPLPWCWLNTEKQNLATTWGFYLGPAWISLTVFLATLFIVFRGVQAQEQRMKRYLLTGNNFTNFTTNNNNNNATTTTYNNTNNTNNNSEKNTSSGPADEFEDEGDDDDDDASSSINTADLENFPVIADAAAAAAAASTTSSDNHHHHDDNNTRTSHGSRISTVLKRKTQRISQNVQQRLYKITHYMEHLPRTRQVIGQAMWYVMACAIVCIVLTIGSTAMYVDDKNNNDNNNNNNNSYRFWIAALQVWFQPLQGWMIFLAYRRPTFLRFRRKGMTILQAVMECFKFDFGALKNGTHTHHHTHHHTHTHRQRTRRPSRYSAAAATNNSSDGGGEESSSGRRRSTISKVLLDISDRAKPLMTVNVTKWFDSSGRSTGGVSSMDDGSSGLSTNSGGRRTGASSSRRTRRGGKKKERRNSHPEPKTDPSQLFAATPSSFNQDGTTTTTTTTTNVTDLKMESTQNTSPTIRFNLTTTTTTIDDSTNIVINNNNNNNNNNITTTTSSSSLLELQKPRRHSEPSANLIMAPSSDDEDDDDDDAGNAYDTVSSSFDGDTSNRIMPTETTTTIIGLNDTEDGGGHHSNVPTPRRYDSVSTMSTLRSSMITDGSSSQKFGSKYYSSDDDDDDDDVNGNAKDVASNRRYTKQKAKEDSNNKNENENGAGEDDYDLEEGRGGDMPSPLISKASPNTTTSIRKKPPPASPHDRNAGRRNDRRREKMLLRQQSQRLLDLVCMDVIPEADDAAETQWRDLMSGALDNDEDGHHHEDGSLRVGPSLRSSNRGSQRGSPLNWSRLAKKIRANPLFQHRSQQFTQHDIGDNTHNNNNVAEEKREEEDGTPSLVPPPPPPPGAIERTQSDQNPTLPPMPSQTVISRARSDQYQTSLPLHQLQPNPTPSPDARFWAKLEHEKKRKGLLSAIEQQHGTPIHRSPPNNPDDRKLLEKEQSHNPAPLRRQLSRSESNREIARRELDKKRAELLGSISARKLSAEALRQSSDNENDNRGGAEGPRVEGPPPAPVASASSTPNSQQRRKRPQATAFWSRFSNRNLGDIQETNEESFSSLHHSGLGSSPPQVMRYGNGSEFFGKEGTKEPSSGSHEVSDVSFDSKKTIQRSNQRQSRMLDIASTIPDVHQRSSELSSYDGDSLLKTVEDGDDDGDPSPKILSFESSAELNQLPDIGEAQNAVIPTVKDGTSDNNRSANSQDNNIWDTIDHEKERREQLRSNLNERQVRAESLHRNPGDTPPSPQSGPDAR